MMASYHLVVTPPKARNAALPDGHTCDPGDERRLAEALKFKCSAACYFVPFNGQLCHVFWNNDNPVDVYWNGARDFLLQLVERKS